MCWVAVLLTVSVSDPSKLPHMLLLRLAEPRRADLSFRTTSAFHSAVLGDSWVESYERAYRVQSAMHGCVSVSNKCG